MSLRNAALATGPSQPQLYSVVFSQVLSELPVAEDLIAALPPNARTALGPQLYRLVGTAVARMQARARGSCSQRMLVVR